MGKRVTISAAVSQAETLNQVKKFQAEARSIYRIELNDIKRRRNVSNEELAEIESDSKYWKDRLKSGKEFSDEEERAFWFYMEKRRLRIPKIERMILNCKRSSLSVLLNQLHVFGIDVHMLLFNRQPSSPERQEYMHEINRLKKEIAFYKEREVQNFKIMDLQNTIIKQERHGILTPTPSHLMVVTNEE